MTSTNQQALPPDPREYLNPEQLKAIKQVVGGCDVVGYALAKTLREVEGLQKKHGHLLIDICPVQGEYGVNQSLPYFGCIALRQGVELVERGVE